MFAFRLDPAANRGVGVAFTDRLDGFSEGILGPLNLGRPELDDRLLLNVAALRTRLGLAGIAITHQVHGNAVHLVEHAPADDSDFLADPADLPQADALVTRVPGVALAVRAADCVPVLLADPQAGLVAAAHAGRVGLVDGVLEATVGRLRSLGATDLTAWIGPHICGRCYELPADLAASVATAVPAAAARTSWGTPAADLGAGAAAVLEGLGCRVARVDGCTYESPELHSHRRDGVGAGRMAGVIWLAADRVSA